MSSDRRRQAPSLPTLAVNGRQRYLRWSHRYNTYQVLDPMGHTWRNVRPEIARCYIAAAFPTYLPSI